MDGQQLSLAPLVGNGERSNRSVLLVDGAETGGIVEGTVLKTALSADFGTLALVTDGCPHEEILHAYLLDEQWSIVDQLSIGAMYSPGGFRDLEPVDINTYTFCFWGDEDRFTLSAHAPRWSVHPFACTVFKFFGPVMRPFAKLVSRSSLSLRLPFRY